MNKVILANKMIIIRIVMGHKKLNTVKHQLSGQLQTFELVESRSVGNKLVHNFLDIAGSSRIILLILPLLLN